MRIIDQRIINDRTYGVEKRWGFDGWVVTLKDGLQGNVPQRFFSEYISAIQFLNSEDMNKYVKDVESILRADNYFK